MMTLSRSKLSSPLLTLLLFPIGLGCSGRPDAEFEHRTLYAGLGENSHLYLRCNSTSWNVDESSRLKPTADVGVFEVEFNVSQAWMTTTGDDCILTETPTLNGWGNWQRYYRTVSAPVVVPGTVSLVQQPQGVASNFRVRFPATGTFRAVVNTGAFTISFGEPGAQAGELLWAAPQTIAVDDFGNVYRGTADRTRVDRLNPETGVPIWTHAANGDVTLPREITLPRVSGGACAFEDALIVRENASSLLVALDRDDGSTLWSSSGNGAFSAAPITAIACSEDHSTIFAAQAGGVVAIARATGDVVWSIGDAESIPNLTFLGSQTLAYLGSSGGALTLVGLDTGNGNQLFSRPVASNIVTGPGNALYDRTGTSLTRVHVATGVDIWSITHDNAFIERIESAAVFLSSGSEFRRIDAATGTTEWTYPMDATTFADALDNGLAAVFVRNANGTASVMTALDATTGAELWTSSVSGSLGGPLTDAEGRLYFSSGGLGTPPAGTLQRLDVSTGALLWSYAAPLSGNSTSSDVREIMDSDADSLYLRYANFNPTTGPFGLSAVDAQTGGELWDNFDGTDFVFAGSDEERLFTLLVGRGGDIEGRAFAK